MDNSEINKKLIDITFGNTIREYRENKEYTQAQLAELIGVSTKYISKIETGARRLSTENLIKCMEVLEFTPNTLYNQLIKNSIIKKQLELSNELNKLSEDKLNFILKMIKELK